MIKFNIQLFGGRGAGGGRGLSDGPTPAGNAEEGNSYDFPLAENQRPKATLKEALGTKGKIATVNEALDRANPYYSPAFSAYSYNCQRAVVAYELQRRGYDVMALPTYNGDKMPNYAGGGNHYWQGAFQKARRERISAIKKDVATRKLNEKLLSYGDGARAVVEVHSKSGGHVFNAEVRNGKVRYVDAQTNQEYDPKRVLAHVNTKDVGVIRTDNLRVSDRARQMVTPRNTLELVNKRR